jgi:hypothetical protein
LKWKLRTQEAFLGVSQFEVLIRELLPVDRFAARAFINIYEHQNLDMVHLLTIASRKITTLYHEIIDYAVESRPFVSETLFPSS